MAPTMSFIAWNYCCTLQCMLTLQYATHIEAYHGAGKDQQDPPTVRDAPSTMGRISGGTARGSQSAAVGKGAVGG